MVPNDTQADQCTRCRPWHGAAPGGWGRRDGVPVWLIPLAVDHGARASRGRRGVVMFGHRRPRFKVPRKGATPHFVNWNYLKAVQ